jgi:putative FmdB family regulatory protein
MPTYEYECGSCGHAFEAFQSIKDEPLGECPRCGGGIRRIINGGGGVIFKGSGFYTTDKAKAGAKTGSAPEGKPGAPKPDVPKTGGGKESTACASCPAAGASCPGEKAAG